MDDEGKRPYTNTRQIRRDNDRKLLYLVLLTLIIVGGGVITLVYGGWGLVTAMPVLLGGVFLILVPYGVLVGLQKWRDKMERDAWDEAQNWGKKQEDQVPDSFHNE